MAAGYITLGDLARFRTAIIAACNRCERRGRLSVTRLVAVHGPHLPVPELRQIVAKNCPRMIEGKISDPCGVHFPGLAD